MVVPLSQLDRYIAETLLAIQRACAHCAAQPVPVTTEPPEAVNFTINVIDDTKDGIDAGETQNVQPETSQTTTTDDNGTSTTTQEAVTSEETQVNETETTVFNPPNGGAILVNELSMQYHGRGVVTTTSETI